MIGSDWPVCTLSGDYASTMSIVIDYVQQFPAEVREAILGGNCARFYGINPPQKTMSETMLAGVLHGAKISASNRGPARTAARHGAAARPARGHLRIGLALLRARLLRRVRADAAVHSRPRVDRRRGRRGGGCEGAGSRRPRHGQPGPGLRLLRLLQGGPRQSVPPDHHARQRQHHAADGRRVCRICHGAGRPMSRAAAATWTMAWAR